MKEFGKTLLLIILTISALFMTSAVFVRESFEEVYSEKEYKINNILSLVKPQNYSISFGDSFIKIYSDDYENISIRDEYNKIFKNIIDGLDEVIIEESDVEVWQEQIRRKSIRVDYPFPIVLKDLLSVYDYEADIITSNSINVSSILFTANQSKYIYTFDERNNKYYRIPINTNGIWIDTLYNEIASIEDRPNEYRMIEDRFGLTTLLAEYDLKEENLVLTPIKLSEDYPKYMLMREFDVLGNSSGITETYAKRIFNNDMAFVKKTIYYDKSTIYIYGYGEKVFKVNVDGSLEYLSKATENSLKKPIDFIEGIGKSLTQIEKMGIVSNTIYLSNYSQNETSEGYETVYNFNYKSDGVSFYTPQTGDGSVIEVKFLNDDLIKAKKVLGLRGEKKYNAWIKPYDFYKIFTKDTNEIEFVLRYKEDHEELTVSDEDIYLMLIYEMKSLELDYLIDSSGLEELLIPVWNMVIADTRYFIDIYTGEIVRVDKE